MSAAANSWLKDKPLLTIGISFLSSLILAFSVRSANISKEEMDSKATKVEVHTAFEQHEKKEIEVINPIKERIVSLEQADKDARTEYLKEIQLLRKDILDLYRSK